MEFSILNFVCFVLDAANSNGGGANQANDGQFLLNRLIANAENENVKIETAKADG